MSRIVVIIVIVIAIVVLIILMAIVIVAVVIVIAIIVVVLIIAIRERVSVVYPSRIAAEPPTIHVLIVVENTNIPHVFRWCALTLIIAVRAEP